MAPTRRAKPILARRWFSPPMVSSPSRQKPNSTVRSLSTDRTMARFYLGMAADQDGRRAEAEAIWRDLLAKAPPGAAYVEMIRRTLERSAPGAAGATASA